MNYPIVFRLLAIILWTLAGAMALCAPVDLLYPDSDALSAFAISVAVTATVGLIFFLCGRGAKKVLFRKEALALIGLGWILASFFASLPIWLGLPGCSFVDALFEGTSGLTTTGATVFTGLEDWPRSLLLWRAMSQWIGGLGVVVFFVAILGFLGAQAKLLYSNEASATSGELDDSRIQAGVLWIICVYVGLSVACTVAYHICGLNWYDSIAHMMTTVSTGGFSTRTDSIGAFANPALEWTAIVFMFLGGVSFILILRLVRRHPREVFRNSEFKAYLLILAAATTLGAVLLGAFEHPRGVEPALREAAFQVVSIVTTTGYATQDYMQWHHVLQGMLFLFMVIGGCSGSTSGGLKIIRMVLGLKTIQVSLERAYRPSVVRTVKIDGRSVSADDRVNVLQYTILAMSLVGLGYLLLAMLEPDLTVIGGLSATLSAFFNIGPGIEEVGPTQTYAFFQPGTKVLLSLLMITGRVEIYAVLVLVLPAFWRRFR